MPPNRKLRINIRNRLTLAACVLLAVIVWLSRGDPPEIERSRAIQPGMSFNEVYAEMGSAPTYYRDGYGVYGISLGNTMICVNKTLATLGIRFRWVPQKTSWPVRIRFNADNRVVRIERGSEAEEAQPE